MGYTLGCSLSSCSSSPLPLSPVADLVARLLNSCSQPWLWEGPVQESSLGRALWRLQMEYRREGACCSWSLVSVIGLVVASALLPHRETVELTAHARQGPIETSCCWRSPAQGCFWSISPCFSPQTHSFSPPSPPNPPCLQGGCV